MKRIIAAAAALLIAGSAIAKDVPTVPKSPGIVEIDSTTDSPCWNEKMRNEMELNVRVMIVRPWIKQANETKDRADKDMVKYINGWLEASSVTIIPKKYYKGSSNKGIAICSFAALVNGGRVVVSGYEGRNLIRFVAINGEVAIIDYDIAPVGPWSFPDPKKPMDG